MREGEPLRQCLRRRTALRRRRPAVATGIVSVPRILGWTAPCPSSGNLVLLVLQIPIPPPLLQPRLLKHNAHYHHHQPTVSHLNLAQFKSPLHLRTSPRTRCQSQSLNLKAKFSQHSLKLAPRLCVIDLLRKRPQQQRRWESPPAAQRGNLTLPDTLITPYTAPTRPWTTTTKIKTQQRPSLERRSQRRKERRSGRNCYASCRRMGTSMCRSWVGCG
jgi:hypothetical protein